MLSSLKHDSALVSVPVACGESVVEVVVCFCCDRGWSDMEDLVDVLAEGGAWYLSIEDICSSVCDVSLAVERRALLTIGYVLSDDLLFNVVASNGRLFACGAGGSACLRFLV